ncbi:hypothetical protein [Sandarakinorhabdus sp. AAP62]|nr:hypothetical protein [Sandarakinorhabdus sp. AAP62]
MRGKLLGDFGPYRIGDWRIISDRQDGVMPITVIRLGNRREVLRR